MSQENIDSVEEDTYENQQSLMNSNEQAIMDDNHQSEASEDENALDENDVNDNPDYTQDNEKMPALPPKKPPNLINYYIEQNRAIMKKEHVQLNNQEISSLLRKKWKEELGKKEKQLYKNSHKNLKSKFNHLLDLYKLAHPEFDEILYYQQQSRSERETTKSSSSHNKKKRSRENESQSYELQMSDGDDINQLDDEMHNNDNEEDNDNDNNAHKSKKRKKTNNNNDDDDDNNNNNNNDSYVGQLFNEIKAKGSRRKKDEDFTADENTLESMRSFITLMKDTAKKDWDANRKKLPTVYMLQLLPDVIKQLSKKLLYKDFLDHCYVLDVLRDWVHPLPDGSLPPIRVRTEIYRIIEKMQLHKEEDLSTYLAGSEENTNNDNMNVNQYNNNNNSEHVYMKRGFGKTLMHLWQHPQETIDNKEILRRIMLKWIRKLTQSNVSYNEMRDNEAESKDEIKRRNDILKKQKPEYNIGQRKRARIPERPYFDFAIQPLSKNFDEQDTENRQQKKISKHVAINEKFRTLKKNIHGQAVQPSVTGKR